MTESVQERSKKLVFKMEGKNQAQKEAVFFALKQAGYHWFGREINTIDDPIEHYSVICIYPSDKEITHGRLHIMESDGYAIFEDLETLYMICDFTMYPEKYNKQETGMERLEKLIKNTQYGKVNVGKVELPFGERVLQHIQATPPTWTDFSGKVQGSLEYGDDVTQQDWYAERGIEPIDILKSNMTPEQYYGFLFGNLQKYITRHEYKNKVKDLEKAQVYLGWMIEEYKNGRKK